MPVDLAGARQSRAERRRLASAHPRRAHRLRAGDEARQRGLLRGAGALLVQGLGQGHDGLCRHAVRAAELPQLDRAGGEGHPGAAGMAAALHRAQQLGPGRAARLDRGGAFGLAGPRVVSIGDDRDLSRRPLQSAHAAGRGQGAVRGGDRRHPARAIPTSTSNGK